MSDLDIEIDSVLDADIREALRKSAFWLDARLEDLSFRTDDGRTILTVGYEGKQIPEQTHQRVLELIENIVTSSVEFPSEVIFQRTSDRASARTDPFPEMLKRGWLREEVTGAHLFSGPMAKLYLGLDAWFAERFRELGAEDVILPSMLSPRTLLDTGYVDLNNRALNYVFHLEEGQNDVSRLDDKAGALNMTGVRTTAQHPGVVMTPASCQPVYHAHAGETLNGPQISTGYAKCYRYESRAHAGLARAREFGVREFIQIGTAEEIQETQGKLLELAVTVINELGMDAKLATASDPFFADVYSEYRMFQVSRAVKHEIQAWLPFDDSWSAVASVNQHSTHFGSAWNITTEGGAPAHSCCMGFGIDRWVHAVVAQHGLSARAWPTTLRSMIS